MKVLSIISVNSKKDNLFYTRHEDGINVVDVSTCYVVSYYSKGIDRLPSALGDRSNFCCIVTR
jgi:hypothetical protein